jgi:hypothetical protein
MALAGFVIGGLFQLFGLTPTHHFIAVFQTAPSWNYNTFLDIAALALIALLGWRFFRTGGLEMLRMMESAPAGDHHQHEQHDEHSHHHH